MLRKTEFSRIGEVLYGGELPNGLRIRVVPKKGFRSCFAVLAADYGGDCRVFTLDGQRYETPAGVAHYLEHKMFDMPEGDNALNLLTANGADPNAFTGNDMTCYYFQCTEHFEENLRLLLRFVYTPHFTEETVQKEQSIIAEEIRMDDDDPGFRLFYNLFEQLYARHPIRERVIGTVESIRRITPELLHACYRAFYAPSNMCLCVAGDVDPERVWEIAAEALSAERAPIPEPDYGEPEDSLLPVEPLRRQTMPVSAPQFLIGAKFESAGKGEALLRQRLVSQLSLRLLFGASSPFYTQLYAEGLLNRDFDYEAEFISGTASVFVGGESEEPEKVFEALKRDAHRVAEEGFSEERFQRAKRASLGARLRGLEDFGNVCISLVSGVFEGYCSLDAIGMLDAVTKAECEAFVREVFAPERLALSIMEPK